MFMESNNTSMESWLLCKQKYVNFQHSLLQLMFENNGALGPAFFQNVFGSTRGVLPAYAFQASHFLRVYNFLIIRKFAFSYIFFGF